jgi:hypothetical protein
MNNKGGSMKHEYQENEIVRINRKNYDEIKNGYDSAIDRYEDEIEALTEENEKLKSAVCVVNVERTETFKTTSPETVNIEILNKESEFYPFVKKYFNSNSDLTERKNSLIQELSLLEARVQDFQNSFIGKFLNFFRVRV